MVGCRFAGLSGGLVVGPFNLTEPSYVDTFMASDPGTVVCQLAPITILATVSAAICGVRVLHSAPCKPTYNPSAIVVASPTRQLLTRQMSTRQLLTR
jgi:hypothetical protein